MCPPLSFAGFIVLREISREIPLITRQMALRAIGRRGRGRRRLQVYDEGENEMKRRRLGYECIIKGEERKGEE